MGVLSPTLKTVEGSGAGILSIAGMWDAAPAAVRRCLEGVDGVTCLQVPGAAEQGEEVRLCPVHDLLDGYLSGKGSPYLNAESLSHSSPG